MTRYFLFPSLAALTICAYAGVAAIAAPGESSGSPGIEKMQHWAADREAILDAKLAGIKAVLKLSPDQEKLWTPFESAVRNSAKWRIEHMESMMNRMREMRDMTEETHGTHDMKDMRSIDSVVSPIDRLEALSQRMSERAAAIKTIVDAVKPFYVSLDESQKRLFSVLGGETLLMGQGHRHSGMMGGMGMGMGMMGGHREMMSEGAKSMMGHDPDGMKMMETPPNDDEDSADEE